MSLFTFNVYDSDFNKKELKKIYRLLLNNNLKLDKIMAEQSELAIQLQDLTAQVVKIGAEIVAKVEALEAAILAADDVTPEVQAAFDALKVQVQVLDDLNPDA